MGRRRTSKLASLGDVYMAVASAAQASVQSPIAAANGANPNLGHPAHVNVKKPSDQRFRSFAERYMIARAHHFRLPMSDHTEDQWACIMDAKRAYAMIQRVGQNIEPEDGVF